MSLQGMAARIVQLEAAVAELQRLLGQWQASAPRLTALPAMLALGVLDDDLSPGETAVVSIWDGPIGEEEDTGTDIDGVGLWFQDFALSQQTRVIIGRFGWKWYVVWADC
ncbi:MAG: hypothetical protein AB7O62_00425 [Pirellulales bacterium]